MSISQKMHSIRDLKKSLASSGGGGVAYVKYIGRDQALNVRFLGEPETWVYYEEHYVEGTGKKDPGMSFPCIRDNCPGCEIGNVPRPKYLVNAVDMDKDYVIPLQLPKSLAVKLVSKYEKNGTLLDRNYELSRTGTGLNTEYDLDAGYPQKIKVAKYQALDLEAILQAAFDEKFADRKVPQTAPKRKVRPRARSEAAKVLDEKPAKTKESPEPAPTRQLKKHKVDDLPETKAPKKKPAAVTGKTAYSKKILEVMSMGQLRALAKDEKIDPRGMTQEEIIKALMDVPPF